MISLGLSDAGTSVPQTIDHLSLSSDYVSPTVLYYLQHLFSVSLSPLSPLTHPSTRPVLRVLQTRPFYHRLFSVLPSLRPMCASGSVVLASLPGQVTRVPRWYSGRVVRGVLLPSPFRSLRPSRNI